MSDMQERTPNPLGQLHRTRMSLQKVRIGLGNRVDASRRGVDDNLDVVTDVYDKIRLQAEEWEGELNRVSAKQLETFPVWDHWLRHVKGIGPLLAVQMLALLHTPQPNRGPSTWSKAAGMNPSVRPDGQSRLPRPRVGEGTITYHPGLRKTLYLVGLSFVKTGGYYREVYDARKARLVSQHKDDPANWPPHRLDSVAKWMAVRLFLSHLWEKWLESEGRGPGRRAYVLDVLKHQHYIAPPEWDGKSKI